MRRAMARRSAATPPNLGRHSMTLRIRLARSCLLQPSPSQLEPFGARGNSPVRRMSKVRMSRMGAEDQERHTSCTTGDLRLAERAAGRPPMAPGFVELDLR